MEIFRTFNVYGSGIDHDLLFCYRWMDRKIFFYLYYFWWERCGFRCILYIIYYIRYCTRCIYADLSGTDCLDRISWCGKGNRKVFQDHYAGADSSDCDHCDFFTDTVPYWYGWNCPHRYAGAGCLSQTGFSWTDGKTFPGDPSGCDEPVILFLKCIYGNHDHLWFLCEKWS